jgi:hypothetical protein
LDAVLTVQPMVRAISRVAAQHHPGALAFAMLALARTRADLKFGAFVDTQYNRLRLGMLLSSLELRLALLAILSVTTRQEPRHAVPKGAKIPISLDTLELFSLAACFCNSRLCGPNLTKIRYS